MNTSSGHSTNDLPNQTLLYFTYILNNDTYSIIMSHFCNFPASDFMTDFEIVEIQNEIYRQKRRQREIQNERRRNNEIRIQEVEDIIDNAIIVNVIANIVPEIVIIPPPVSPIPATPTPPPLTPIPPILNYSDSEENNDEDTYAVSDEEEEGDTYEEDTEVYEELEEDIQNELEEEHHEDLEGEEVTGPAINSPDRITNIDNNISPIHEFEPKKLEKTGKIPKT